MALIYFCELENGFVKHIHEQTDPPAENRTAVVQGCVGQNDIVKAYEVPADQADAQLTGLVLLGVTDQKTAAHVLRNFNARHAADMERAGKNITVSGDSRAISPTPPLAAGQPPDTTGG